MEQKRSKWNMTQTISLKEIDKMCSMSDCLKSFYGWLYHILEITGFVMFFHW